MPSLCGLLQRGHWEFSTWKVLFFLNTPPVLHFGAGASAMRTLSSYFEFCLITVIYDFRFPCFELVLVGSFSFGMRIWVLLMTFYQVYNVLFIISTQMNKDYVVTKESYVTMMGPICKCLILFMIGCVFKYGSWCFYISRLLRFALLLFFSLLTFHFGKQNPKLTKNKWKLDSVITKSLWVCLVLMEYIKFF